MKTSLILITAALLLVIQSSANSNSRNFADLEIICANDTTIIADGDECGRLFIHNVPNVINSQGAVEFSLVSGLPSGSIFPIGEILQTWQAVDSAGNIVLCSYVVTVEDATPPVVICPNSVNAYVNESCEYEIMNVMALSEISDNCQVASITQSPPMGNLSSGQSLITVNVLDTYDNLGQCFVTVMDVDTIAPIIECPEDQTLPVLVDCMSSLPNFLIDLDYSDNCTSNMSLEQSPSPGTLIENSTVIILEATDNFGNTNSCTFYALPEQLDNSTTHIGNTITASLSGASYQWVDCGGTKPLPIPGEVTQSFTPTESGSYAVMITQGNCTLQSDCVELTISSLFEIQEQNNFDVYPNPSNGMVTLAVKEVQNSKVDILISDVLGQLVLSKCILSNRAYTLDLSNLTKGNYTINAISENGNYHKRVVMQ